MSQNAVTLTVALCILLLLFHATIPQSHATSLAVEARDPQEDDVTTASTTESTSVDLRPFHVSSSLPSASDPELPPEAISHSLRPRRVRCGGGHHVSRVMPVEVPYGNDMLMEKSKTEEKIKKKKKKLKRNSDSDSDTDSDSDEEEEEEEEKETKKRMKKMKWNKKKEGSGGFFNWISKLMAF